MNRERGHTLIEMMVAMALSAIISLGVASLYISQSAVTRSETHRDQAQLDAHYAFDVVTRLLRQAVKSSVSVHYPGAEARRNNAQESRIKNDALRVDFLLPSGYGIWPNDKADNSGNFPNPAIRLSWHNTAANQANQIRIASAPTIADLDSAALRALTGGELETQTRIINLDVWPLAHETGRPQPSEGDPASGGYLVQLTARAAQGDATFQHAGNDDELRFFRTYTVSGNVAPRN